MEGRISKRAGVIRKIIEERERVRASTGKTVIQKLIYFIQSRGLDLDYRFTLYTYGPYSPELMEDMDIASENGYINMVYNPAYLGYVISSGERDIEDDLLTKEEINVIEEVMNNYAGYSAKELELRATIQFFHDRLEIPEKDMIPEIKEIKPKFSEEDIRSAINEMKEIGYIYQ